MNERNCLHFSQLPMGMRTLYTSTIIVLAVGYLFAMIHIFASHAGRDGNPSLSVNDLIIAYSGSKSDTRLESALKGPMANMLPQAERDEIVAWIRRGAKEEEFATMDMEENKGTMQDKQHPLKIDSIIQNRCSACHNGSNPHIPNLMGYDNISKVIEIDTGMDIFTLVRVSHIHLFGITFIFFIVGSIFCHAYVKPLWLKCIILLTPFAAILLDIGSWYLTKVFPPFAWVVMISGGLMGITFAIQCLTSLYQMWFYKLPDALVKNDGVVS
ncbi:MAG: hypothetical protein GXP19_04750 [Gammaproteobacteria bacterium]|nr:hypothetical protein [Gammaproteobacteria bacterium]